VGLGVPTRSTEDDGPGASLFRVIEPEGSSGIRPSAGAGVAAFKIRAWSGGPEGHALLVVDSTRGRESQPES